MAEVNWAAVLAGVVAALALGFLVYGPMGFQKRWAEGSRLRGPPESFPVGAFAAQVVALFLLALVIGLTETTGALGVAVVAILAVAAQAASVGAWAQKSGFAIAIDAGYAIAAGVLMIAAQALI